MRIEGLQTVYPANQYQKQESGVAEKWVSTCRQKAFRDFTATKLDQFVRINSNPFAVVAKTAAPITSQARGYSQVFNIGTDVLEISPGQKLASYSDVFTKKGMGLVKKTAINNFKTAKFCPENYFTKTVIADNLKNITTPMAQGKIFTACGKLFGPVMASASVVLKTGKTYNQTGSKTETVKTFTKECGKSLIAWEAGKIGFTLGALIFPVGIFGVIGKIVGMGLSSTLAYKASEKIIG